MSENTKEIVENTQAEENPNKKSISPARKRIIKFFAVVFWIGIIIKWFIFNYEDYIISEYFYNYSWINYLTIFRIAIIILVGLLVYRFIFQKSIMWSLYVLLFPFVILFWNIPYMIIRNKYWFFAISVVKAIIAFFSSLKYLLIALSIYILAFIFIFLSYNNILLGASIFSLFILIFLTCIKRIFSVFKPSSETMLFRKLKPYLYKFADKSTDLDDNLLNIKKTDYDEGQLSKWIEKLQYSVLANRCFLFMAKKLKEYKVNNYNILYSIITVLFLLFYVILTFSVINYGIFKFDNSSFYINTSTSPNLFSFFYYSFMSLFLNTINDVSPSTVITKIVFMSEFVSSFLILTVFIALILPFLSSKRTNELDKIIDDLEIKSSSLEKSIVINYNVMNIDDAMLELNNAKSSFIRAIYFLSGLIT